MKKKVLLDSNSKQKLSQNKTITFEWESDIEKGTIIKNKEMGVNVSYYAIVDEKDDFQYDTFGIEERKGNCVSVVLNQKNCICLISEYRVIPEKFFLSCPRGSSKIQESRLQCSLREIEEEVGDFRLIDAVDLGEMYQNTTFFSTPLGVYLVKIEIKNERGIKESQLREDIFEINFYEPTTVKKMIQEGKINCLITLGALSKYFSYIET